MIVINEKSYDWIENMNIISLLKTMGYTLRRPSVLIKINKEVIKKSAWDEFIIPENAEITVLNLLRGG